MSDAKRAKLDVEAGTDPGEIATAVDATDPGAPEEAQDDYGYEDEDLAINESDIAAQAEAEQAIAALEVLQRQLMEVNDEASDKVLQIEVEYNQKRQPIYKERSEHLKKLPDFWQLCILQHPVLRSLVTEEDEEALRYIEDIVVEDAPDIKSGYSLQFRFAQNPFFSNAILEKRCAFYDDGTAEITGTQPDWYPGKALTEEAAADGEEGALLGGSGGRKRARVRDSFFLWFEEQKPRGDAADADDPVADIFKEQIWVNPLKWYMEQPEDEDGDEEDEEGEPGGDMAGGADNPIVLEDDELEAYEEYEEGGHPDHGEEGAAGGEEEQLEDYYEEGGEGGVGAEADLEEYEGEEGGEGAHGELAAEEAATVAGAV